MSESASVPVEIPSHWKKLVGMVGSISSSCGGVSTWRQFLLVSEAFLGRHLLPVVLRQSLLPLAVLQGSKGECSKEVAFELAALLCARRGIESVQFVLFLAGGEGETNIETSLQGDPLAVSEKEEAPWSTSRSPLMTRTQGE